MKRTRNHDDAMIEMLRDDPDFAVPYLQAALEDIDEEGGQAGFLVALRHVIDAWGGIRPIAERTGLSRETLYRSLSATGNPTFKTINAVMAAAGVKMSGIQASHKKHIA